MTLRVTFIGSGSAFADGGRSHACIHVTAPGVSLLLDCGGSSLPAIRREVDAEAIGADLFICDATFFDRDDPSHISYRTLMSHRDQLECKRIVLTHLGAETLARIGELEVDHAVDGMGLVV